MRMLFDQQLLSTIKTNEKLPLECYYCAKTFFLTARVIKNHLHKNNKYGINGGRFCSRACSSTNQEIKVELICTQCKLSIKRKKSTVEHTQKRSNNWMPFCSKSCSCTYKNLHKTTGFRRSKLEVWLEVQLCNQYSNVEILFNKKHIINSELDIYIPSLKLAFELNGIVHYEPIYGSEKLSSIKNNDNRKFQACLENQIELVIIDTSQETYFKESKGKKYFDIITSIINQKL